MYLHVALELFSLLQQTLSNQTELIYTVHCGHLFYWENVYEFVYIVFM